MQRKLLLVVAMLSLSATSSLATHLRSIEIRAEVLDCLSRTYRITVIAYTNLGSTVQFGGEDSQLDFGDGARTQIPETVATVFDASRSIARAVYSLTYTYASEGLFTITYLEQNRSSGIVNVAAAINSPYVTTTQLLVNSSCNSSPFFRTAPVDLACTGFAYYHNPAAFDQDGDSLSYEMAAPLEAPNRVLSTYLNPTDRSFYAGNFNLSNETRTGPPTLRINENGLLTWDAPGNVGEYVIAIRIVEWKYSNEKKQWVRGGSVLRDMQVLVRECNNKKPFITAMDEICVEAGKEVTLVIPGRDPDGHQVKIEAFIDSRIESALSINGAALMQAGDTARVIIKWTPTCEQIQNNPYIITLRIVDFPADEARLTNFKTVRFRVVASPPMIEAVTVNPIAKNATISWNHACENVVAFQVWRRVSKVDYSTTVCETGMPAFLRYEMIAELPGTIRSFTDKDLAVGAQYCYRVLGYTKDQRIASRISADTCIIPKKAEAPIITNVSVTRTNSAEGSVKIQWTSPFEIDRAQYPPPYQYKIYRKRGDEQLLSPVSQEPITDTIFIDRNLATNQFDYSYQVVLYVPSLTSNPVDTSALASSVFATVEASFDRIELEWTVATPWSNYSQQNPYHLIFRSTSGEENSFVLHDSVQVLNNGFQYFDRKGLSNRFQYFYKVETRGTYGNRAIRSPLENLSQITAGIRLVDTIPPCRPNASLAKVPCRTIPCASSNYYNIVNWSFSANCDQDDVAYFEIMLRDANEDTIMVVQDGEARTFTHEKISKLAYCYRVAAIDFSGNRSDTSEEVCNDNCPHFELPNAFTPGVADSINDTFTSYDLESDDCPRFVKEVNMKIYDRWGKEIATTSVSRNADYIFWNGRTDNGVEVPPGVYYYSADVAFDVRDPQRQTMNYKGWVHLLR